MLYHFLRFARSVSWLAIIALAVATWTPGDEMVRTGLNGHLEHVIAYLLTALAFMLAYPSRSAWHVGLGLAAYAGQNHCRGAQPMSLLGHGTKSLRDSPLKRAA